MRRSPFVVALVLVSLTAGAEEVCVPPELQGGDFGSYGGMDAYLERWNAWCASNGRWGGDGRCYCADGWNQSGGSSGGYDYAAAQRAAEEQARREAIAKEQERQLQQAARERAERVDKELMALDHKGAVLDLQAKQLDAKLETIKERETRTASVARTLVTIEPPAQQAKTPPLSAAKLLEEARRLPPPQKGLKINDVPAPLPEQRRELTRFEKVTARAFEAAAPLIPGDQLARVRGTAAEISKAVAEELGDLGKEDLTRRLSKVKRLTTLLSVYGEFEKLAALDEQAKRMGRRMTNNVLTSIEESAAELGDPNSQGRLDLDARQQDSAQAVRDFQREVATDKVKAALTSSFLDSVDAWIEPVDD